MSEPSDHYLRSEFERRLPELWPFVAASGIDGWWFWDMRQQEHEYLSPRFWRVLGYDHVGRAHSPEAWRDILHPADRQAAVAAIEPHIEHGTPYDLIVRYLPGRCVLGWSGCGSGVGAWWSEATTAPRCTSSAYTRT